MKEKNYQGIGKENKGQCSDPSYFFRFLETGTTMDQLWIGGKD